MTTTQSTADQIKPGDTITALFAGVSYRGAVRSIDPAVFTTARTGIEHLLITFAGGGYFPGADQSISIPAGQLIDLG